MLSPQLAFIFYIHYSSWYRGTASSRTGPLTKSRVGLWELILGINGPTATKHNGYNPYDVFLAKRDERNCTVSAKHRIDYRVTFHASTAAIVREVSDLIHSLTSIMRNNSLHSVSIIASNAANDVRLITFRGDKNLIRVE